MQTLATLEYTTCKIQEKYTSVILTLNYGISTHFCHSSHVGLIHMGGGSLSLVSISNVPVINRPLFCIFYYRMPSFTTLHPMTPYFCFFDQNFPVKSFTFEKLFKSQWISFVFLMFTLPRFCTISHPMTPFFDLSPNGPLFCNKIVTDSPLIWCFGI